jgi:putative transcriptional regulator
LEGFSLANEDIPALVKDLRKHLGFTQEQLARELGVAFCTVNQWENGRRSPQPFLKNRLLEMKASLDKASTPDLTKAQTPAMPKSWQTVRTKEDKEPASMAVAEKLRQLAKLIDLAQQIGQTEGLVEGEEEIIERWMKLRRVLHA